MASLFVASAAAPLQSLRFRRNLTAANASNSKAKPGFKPRVTIVAVQSQHNKQELKTGSPNVVVNKDPSRRISILVCLLSLMLNVAKLETDMMHYSQCMRIITVVCLACCSVLVDEQTLVMSAFPYLNFLLTCCQSLRFWSMMVKSHLLTRETHG